MSDQIDAVKMAMETMLKLDLIAGIAAPGDEDDTGIPKEMPVALREAIKQALLRHKLNRLAESAKIEIFKKELKELQSQDDDAEKAESYEAARKIVNSGQSIAKAIEAVGIGAGEAAGAMTAFGVASRFPRLHNDKLAGARRLTPAATGTPVVVAADKQLLEDIQDEQETVKTKSKETQPAEFDVRDRLEH